MADGIRFTYRVGAVSFDGDGHEDGDGRQSEIRDLRLVHLHPLCTCGWRGANVPAPGTLAPPAGDGHGDDEAPEEDHPTAHAPLATIRRH